MRRVGLAALVLMVAARAAFAHPPPDPEIAYDGPKDWHDDRAFAEWSTWIRLAYGVASEASEEPGAVARPAAGTPVTMTSPGPGHSISGAFDGGIGADVTFPLPTKKVRLGPWVELRPTGVFGGGEINIAGSPLDMFMYEGERVYTLRAGGGMTEVTASLAYGYRCPWKLWGPYTNGSRYMIGARLVATGTRSVIDPGEWSVSLGLEFEPVGAMRYVGAIKSWY